jgi:succinyl-diaminopimelate desuccinylase
MISPIITTAWLEKAKKLIAINSETHRGNEELVNYLSELMKDIGMEVQLQQVPVSQESFSKRQFNLIGILGDTLVDSKNKKGILFNTHLDTVSPGIVSYWTECQQNPFQMTLKDQDLYGLGVADVKLDFLCKLTAISKFKNARLKAPLYLVGTCGEEQGMFGAKYLIQSRVLNPKFVLVGEPSQMKVITAHKSLNIFSITFDYQAHSKDAKGFNHQFVIEAQGKSAHSAYPHLGVSAIHQLFDLLLIAEENGFDLRLSTVKGGDVINKIPDTALAEVYLTAHQAQDFNRFLSEYLEHVGLKSFFKITEIKNPDIALKLIPKEIIQSIQDCIEYFKSLSQRLKQTTDETYDPPYSSVNLGLIKLIQNQLNQIEIQVDIRLLPSLSEQDLEKQIKEDIYKILSHRKTQAFNVKRLRHNPGLNMTTEHELVGLCKIAMQKSGQDLIIDKKATSTEAAQYFKAGYEAVVVGPGLSQGNSHSPNEKNSISELEKAIKFYEELILRVCL